MKNCLVIFIFLTFAHASFAGLDVTNLILKANKEECLPFLERTRKLIELIRKVEGKNPPLEKILLRQIGYQQAWLKKCLQGKKIDWGFLIKLNK